MKIKVKYDGMLLDCTMSIENDTLVATPVIDIPKNTPVDMNVGYVILLKGVVVIRKIFRTHSEAAAYARKNWQTTYNKFEIRKVSEL